MRTTSLSSSRMAMRPWSVSGAKAFQVRLCQRGQKQYAQGIPLAARSLPGKRLIRWHPLQAGSVNGLPSRARCFSTRKL
jgi:hypothetical protein